MTDAQQGSQEDESADSAVIDQARIDREYAFTFGVILVARRYRAMLDEKLRPMGYGSARMEALSTIARSPEPSAQISIAKRIGIEGPTLTRMLDTLEADGLVVRKQDPTDRRTKLIELTDAGRVALKEITLVAQEFRSSVLAALQDEQLDDVNAVTATLMKQFSETSFG